MEVPPAPHWYSTATGTVVNVRLIPSNFDPKADAKALREAMQGLGTDEKVIWKILTARTNAKRQRISTEYTSMYGRDLIKDLKSELTGNFENVMVSLMRPKNRFDAISLRKAMKGLGTDEGALIEILCTKTNQEIRDVIREYKEEFDRDLVKDVKDDTSGDFKRMFVSILQANRDESVTVDEAAARADAQALYDAGEGKWGTDESKFNEILVTRSYAHLRRVFDIYATISKKDICGAIKSEMSGDLETGMIAIVDCVYSRPTYFAKRLYKAMKGLGTKDNTLVRVIVSRSEIDLPEIKREFKDAYSKSLYDWVHGDTSGDYRDALLALVGQD